MNANPHLDDDALSALVDEPGLHDSDRAHVDLCTTCASRLAALDSARQRLRAAADEPLDEFTRRRLVQTTMAAAVTSDGKSSSRAFMSSRWGTAAAMAAVVAGLIGGISLFTRGTPANKTSSGLAAPTADVRDLGQVGDVSDPATLRAVLSGSSLNGSGFATSDQVAGSAAPGEANQSGADPALGSAGPVAPVAGTATDSRAATRAATTADSARADVCARGLGRKGNPGRLSLRGLGRYHGRDALVIAFERSAGNRTRIIAFVLDPTSCEVLHSQVL